MLAEARPVQSSEIESAIAAVQSSSARSALGALAYDVLSRQAEGRALYTGKSFVETRAASHGVTQANAQTSGGHLLAILEYGAHASWERALVAAFAVSGLGDALVADRDPTERLNRFVRHADWLAVSTDYAVHAFIDPLLGVDTAARVWEAVARAVIEEGSAVDGERIGIRARNVARLSALGSARGSGAATGLRLVADAAGIDQPTQAFASALATHAGSSDLASLGSTVRGSSGRPAPGGLGCVLRWITGWALVSWVVRGAAALVGVRRHVELRAGAAGVEIRTQLSLLGRTLRERDETWAYASIAGARREARYAALPSVVGAVVVTLGILAAGLFAFDGVRSGEVLLLVIAAGLVLGGAALDLALDVFWASRGARTRVEIAPQRGRAVVVTDVAPEIADAFLRAYRDKSASPPR